jgi:hypothetical protein
MNLLQRTLATLSAAGTAALMTLPALAQSTPINSANCSAYINGGVGGPTDTQSSNSYNQSSSSSNQTSTSANQTSPSSYDTASSGVQGNTNVPSGNNNSVPPSSSNVNQFPNESGIAQPSTGAVPPSPSTTNQFGSGQSGETISATEYNTILQAAQSPAHRQFDANNRSAAVAFRSNGPAGTAGHEAKMNLNAYQEGQNLIAERDLNETAIRTASAPIPVACLPR